MFRLSLVGHWTILASFLTLSFLPACGLGQRDAAPGVMPAACRLGDDGFPSPTEVARRMTLAFDSTPVLHVTVINRHLGMDYECHGWMMGKKSLGVVRQDGKVIFASYTDTVRKQEYVPLAKFANGEPARAVLLEYDYDPTDGGWSRLVDAVFDCGPSGVACEGYLQSEGERYPDAVKPNMENAQLTETVFMERPCYLYSIRQSDDTSTLDWDLYVDKATFKPVRMSRLVKSIVGKVLKEDIYEYTFEHLPDDAGIHWGLQPDKLKP